MQQKLKGSELLNKAKWFTWTLFRRKDRAIFIKGPCRILPGMKCSCGHDLEKYHDLMCGSIQCFKCHQGYVNDS
jgi:hypothetical protein